MAQNIQVVTPQSDIERGSSTNATCPGTFGTDVVVTATEPSAGVNGGDITILAPPQRNLSSFLFFGTGSDGDTVDILVWRWYKMRNVADDGYIWIPQIAASIVDGTLSTFVGVSSEVPSSGDRFVDSIVSSETDSAVRTTAVTAPANTPYNLVLDAFGCHYYTVQFKDGSGTGPTSANFLIQGD